MPSNIVHLAIAFESILIALAGILAWLLGVPLLEQVKFDWGGIGWGVAATGPLLLGMWWWSQSSLGPFRRIMHEVEGNFIPLFARCSYLELAVIALLAGVGEEALFRGVIQGALTPWLTPTGGVLAASVLFGLGHLITPTYALLASLIGLYLGGLFMISGNLFLVIIVHALYDFIALIYLIGRVDLRDKAKIKEELVRTSEGSLEDRDRQ